MDRPDVKRSSAVLKGGARHDLYQLAHALGGEVCGGAVLCPGPAHSPTDRSLSVRLAPDAPDGLVVHSFAGDDWRACKAHVLSRLGRRPDKPSDVPRARRAAAENKSECRRKQALRIWREAGDPHGTIVEDYLAGRGLHLRLTHRGRSVFIPAVRCSTRTML